MVSNKITKNRLVMSGMQLDGGCPSARKLRTLATGGACDYFTTIPDEVIIEILNRLPLGDAIASSLVSRRWRNLWKHMTKIDFSPDWYAQRREYALSAICSFMKSHQGPQIQSFHVSVRCFGAVMYIIWWFMTITSCFSGNSESTLLLFYISLELNVLFPCYEDGK